MKKLRPIKNHQGIPQVAKQVLPTNEQAMMESYTGSDPKDVIERIYQSASYVSNDLTRLLFCLAVFDPKENQIYRLSGIDYRGNRFDLSGERRTQWINFNRAELFIFTNKEEFAHYYNLYHEARTKEGMERIRSKEEIFTWLAKDVNRLALPHIELKYKSGDKFIYKVYRIQWRTFNIKTIDIKNSYHKSMEIAQQELTKFWLKVKEQEDESHIEPTEPELITVDEELFNKVQIESIWV